MYPTYNVHVCIFVGVCIYKYFQEIRNKIMIENSISEPTKGVCILYYTQAVSSILH